MARGGPYRPWYSALLHLRRQHEAVRHVDDYLARPVLQHRADVLESERSDRDEDDIGAPTTKPKQPSRFSISSTRPRRAVRLRQWRRGKSNFPHRVLTVYRSTADGHSRGVEYPRYTVVYFSQVPEGPAPSREASGSHRVPGLFREIIGLLLEDVEEAECRLALRRVGVLVLTDLRTQDVGEVRRLLAGGLPGNLLENHLWHRIGS